MIINVYISNSTNKQDKSIKDLLIRHFKVLTKSAGFNVFSNDDIQAGMHKEATIQEFISKADVIIPLLSVDYINKCSDEIDFLEELVIQETEYGDKIFPIIVRPCTWQYTTFSHYQIKDLTVEQKDIEKSLSFFVENIFLMRRSFLGKKESARKSHYISPIPARAGDVSNYDEQKKIPDNSGGLEFGNVVIQIEGRSAEPFYSNGDYVLCRRIETKYERSKTGDGLIVTHLEDIRPNQVYIIETETRGLVAKVIDLKNSSSDFILLKSANREFDDINIPLNEVKGIWKIKNVISPK